MAKNTSKNIFTIIEKLDKINNYFQLKNVIESLIHRGKLDRYVSDPNFVQGLSFANILILASRIELFDTNFHARRKIIRCFGEECGKYPKGRAKGSF